MCDQEKIEYLLHQFCFSDFERKEMCKWIDERGVKYVYTIVLKLFEKK